MTDLSKTYNPKEVEEKWLKTWIENKLFESKVISSRDSFSISLPPPNVTGNLHMGHAFSDVIQDVLIRYNLMNGKNVLWQGGTDHAGIATQVLVERDLLRREKKRKEDLGRKEFLRKVWEWKEKHGNEIIDQMKKLGCFMDYDRLFFTMDENYSRAIKKVFTALYKKGLIYRGKRIVNWCPKCLTSLSDLEVETEYVKGKLYHILYPFDVENIPKGGITVATTRPETMFGDIAVCVNPEDIRYKKLIGTKVTLPLINKEIPVISDHVIKMDFGTGAVKTTPAHDANDYEIFQRNKNVIQQYGTYFFPFPVVMGEDGKIVDKDNIGIPSDLRNQDRFKARELTIKKLSELWLLRDVTEYEQLLEKHDRCGTILEPYLSEQWYVRMQPLAEPAIRVVEEGKIRFTPGSHKDRYLNWLKHIKDWCISRQLWWGHQIPVWYCKGCNHANVSEDAPVFCEKCKNSNLIQDPDVLDTWFSSALWPFVTLGWPDEVIASTKGAKQSRSQIDEPSYFETFYPTSVLATARDIINLWVARMVFMSLEFTNEIPFKEVLVHPVIQTPDGKRMSKSKGNAIDPLEMINKYGADANRFWYFSIGITGNQDVRFPGRKIKDNTWESDVLEQYKRFANKLWNASRFVLQNLDPNKKYSSNLKDVKLENLTVADCWILEKHNELISFINLDFADRKYNFSEISHEIYKFVWDYFCDWYIEISKKQLNDPKLREQTQKILFYILETICRALHPIMPFVTEEIWQSLPLENKNNAFISLSSYPREDTRFLNLGRASVFSHIIETTREIRNQRHTLGIPWTKEIEVRLYTVDDFEKGALEDLMSYVEYLTKSKVILLKSYEPLKPSAGALVSNTRILIPISGLVNLDNMLSTLNKRKIQFEKEIENHKAKLSNTNFINNAAVDIISEVKARVIELSNQIKTIDEQIELLK